MLLTAETSILGGASVEEVIKTEAVETAVNFLHNIKSFRRRKCLVGVALPERMLLSTDLTYEALKLKIFRHFLDMWLILSPN